MKLDTQRPLSAHANWLNQAFTKDTAGLIADAKRILPMGFDTIVCTGLSGMLVAPILWRALDVPYLAVVRKEESPASHSGQEIEGAIGQRWIFVDDFVASGATLRRVREAVSTYVGYERHATTFVGTYTYRYPAFLAGDAA